MPRSQSAFAIVMSSALLAGCTSFGAVYPPRPPSTLGALVADPAPSRVVAHVAVTRAALAGSVDAAVPTTGDGSFVVLRSDRRYTWTRAPFDVAFADGHVVLTTTVNVVVDMPLSSVELPLDVRVVAEPVVSTEYRVKLQSTNVKVTTTDRRLVVADKLTGVLDRIGGEIDAKLKDFAYDVRPGLEEAYARISKPIELPIGDARGCAQLEVLGIEAGPTVVADGLEKDVALVVAPRITIPCASLPPPPLPPLANVALVQSGPFTVTVPVVARYDELAKAMGMLFTDGKYYFSTEFPKLYLEAPEIYESQGQIVLKVRVRGPVRKFGIDADIDGDVYFSGHLAVADNAVQIPDLEQTIETRSFFLSLKAMADGDKIRDQARAAMRVDLGERLHAVRQKLSEDLTFGGPSGCFRGDVDRIELSAVHPHGTYLRAYVAVTGRSQLTMPCPAEQRPLALP